MAKETGAFEKYGIDADLIFISAGPVVVQALLGGNLQGGFAATNAVIAPIFEFMGKKPIAVETVADNSIVDRLAREGFVDRLYKPQAESMDGSHFSELKYSAASSRAARACRG